MRTLNFFLVGILVTSDVRNIYIICSGTPEVVCNFEARGLKGVEQIRYNNRAFVDITNVTISTYASTFEIWVNLIDDVYDSTTKGRLFITSPNYKLTFTLKKPNINDIIFDSIEGLITVGILDRSGTYHVVCEEKGNFIN